MPGSRPPTIGFIVEGWSGDHLIVSACKPNSPAARGGFRPGDVVTSIGGLLPMEFLEQALRENLVRVEALRENCEIVLYLEFPVAAPVNAPASSADAPDAPAAAEKDVAPDAPVGPDTSVPNNAGIYAQTFGRSIGDQSWRYGRRGCVSDYGGCTASPTPIDHADNWGDVDNWRTSTPSHHAARAWT
jgi:hypothetical protein